MTARPDAAPARVAQMPASLRTARLILRPWRASDRSAFARMNRDPRVMEFFPGPMSGAESDAAAERIGAHIGEHGWGFWAVEIPALTEFAGFVGLARPRFEAHFTPCVEIGWRLAADCWGSGYASEAAAAALAFGFATLRLNEIVSFTARENQRSIRVMEKIGLVRDAGGDFEHPSLPAMHRLRAHVLYRGRPP